MRIGYCSPFAPMKTGIADFSKELVMALKPLVEIVIFSTVPIENTEITNGFEVYSVDQLDDVSIRSTLDIIVYHMGNNLFHKTIYEMLLKYPGILELHDVGLHHFFAAHYIANNEMESYYNMVQYCHGNTSLAIVKDLIAVLPNGETPWDKYSLQMCMCKGLIDASTGVIIHSEMAKQMVLGIRSDVPIAKIMLHADEIGVISEKNKTRKQLDLDANQLIFGSFGLATNHKRITPTLKALGRYKREITSNFTYCIVGEVEQNYLKEVESLIKEYQLEKQVKITGFVDIAEFKDYMKACDIAFNLRYPTQGESSASLHRLLGMGIPLIVTAVGTFNDYPDDVALTVSYDANEDKEIFEALCTLTKNEKTRHQYSRNAVLFAEKNCSLEKNALKYKQFFQDVHYHTWTEDYEDTIISKLIALGLTDPEYLAQLPIDWIPSVDM